MEMVSCLLYFFVVLVLVKFFVVKVLFRLNDDFIFEFSGDVGMIVLII